jgi:hypothetical protein
MSADQRGLVIEGIELAAGTGAKDDDDPFGPRLEMAGTRGERVARVDLRRRTKKLANDTIVVSGPRSTAGKQTSER